MVTCQKTQHSVMTLSPGFSSRTVWSFLVSLLYASADVQVCLRWEEGWTLNAHWTWEKRGFGHGGSQALASSSKSPLFELQRQEAAEREAEASGAKIMRLEVELAEAHKALQATVELEKEVAHYRCAAPASTGVSMPA